MNKIGKFICLLLFLTHASPLTAGELGQPRATPNWPLSLQDQAGYDETDLNNVGVIPSKFKHIRNPSHDGRLILELPRFFPNLYVMTTPIEFENGGNKHVKLTVADKMYSTDIDLESQIIMNEVDLAIYYDIPFVKTLSADILNIDLGLNVRTVDFDGNIGHEQIGKTSKHFVVPIPMVFGALQFHPSTTLALEAEGRGVSLGDNKAFSLVGRIRWNVMDQVFATGGYRFDKFDINYQGVLIDADISGPFFEAGLSF